MVCVCEYMRERERGKERQREGEREREREREGERERESCIQDSGMLGVVCKSLGSNKISQLLRRFNNNHHCVCREIPMT